jgi:hypothetical protein
MGLSLAIQTTDIVSGAQKSVDLLETWCRRPTCATSGDLPEFRPVYEVVRHPGEAVPRPRRLKLFSTNEKGQDGRNHQKPSPKEAPDGICD